MYVCMYVCMCVQMYDVPYCDVRPDEIYDTMQDTHVVKGVGRLFESRNPGVCAPARLTSEHH